MEWVLMRWGVKDLRGRSRWNLTLIYQCNEWEIIFQSNGRLFDGPSWRSSHLRQVFFTGIFGFHAWWMFRVLRRFWILIICEFPVSFHAEIPTWEFQTSPIPWISCFIPCGMWSPPLEITLRDPLQELWHGGIPLEIGVHEIHFHGKTCFGWCRSWNQEFVCKTSLQECQSPEPPAFY